MNTFLAHVFIHILPYMTGHSKNGLKREQISKERIIHFYHVLSKFNILICIRIIFAHKLSGSIRITDM
jgi:hypothetical protein